MTMEKTGFVRVFQYGSNISTARMRDEHKRIPSAEPLEAAWTIELYNFCFPVYSRSGGRAASGIKADSNGRQIFGAVYSIPESLVYRDPGNPKEISLDAIEGEGSNYSRETIRITGIKSGETYDAITYLPLYYDCGEPTDADYAGYILAGLSEWNAPAEYTSYIARVIDEALQRTGIKAPG
jgi:hypothetical protein